MRVLIVGAFGYFGQAIMRRLLPEHSIVAAGRFGTGAALPAGVTGLIGEAETLTPADLDGVDALICLAGGGVRVAGEWDPIQAIRDNVDAVLHVGIAGKAAGVPRMILASSAYVYGLGTTPRRESDLRRADTLYGAMKITAEAAWRASGGISLRLANLYGPSVSDVGRDGVTERLARSVATGAEFEMLGDGTQRIGLLHIRDACDAMTRAILAPGLLPVSINVGGHDSITVAGLVHEFRRVSGRPIRVRHRDGLVPFPGEYRMDISLAAEVLGWHPTTPLREGVAGLIREAQDRAAA